MTKIKHVMEPHRELYAAYIFNREPFGAVVPVLYTALVDRWGEDSKTGERINETHIIGYVINGKIQPADEVDRSFSRFLGYQDKASVPHDQWQAYLTQLIQWGRSWYQESQPVPVQVRRFWADEEPERAPVAPAEDDGEIPEGVEWPTTSS